MLELIIAASLTTVATGIGAIPVILMGSRAETLRPMLLGIAAGVMIVASCLGLIGPALDRGSLGQVAAGVALGVVFLLGARKFLSHGSKDSAGLNAGATSLLVFLVLFVHSLPEGFAIGTAYAEDPSTIGLFIVIAIAIQNIPEGTSVAIPLAANGASPTRQVLAAILSSVPQPIGAVIAFLLVGAISGLLPISFGFAAGAMLALSLIELVPQGFRAGPGLTIGGLLAGAAVMVVLDGLLGV
jgi:ZIP family zinc transporter